MVNESFTLKMIQVEMLKVWGVEVSYDKTYRAKQKVLAKIICNWDESFAQLKRSDRDNVTVLKWINGHFHRFFWTFGASLRSFKQHLRPIIIMDGTHITGKYSSCLIGATAMDGGNNIFQSAFAIMEIENKYT